ncbi:Hypothetical predicted protein, partial [Pelobates cultripes]
NIQFQPGLPNHSFDFLKIPQETPYLRLHTVLEGGSVKPLESLMGPERPTTLQIFKYAQLTHYIRSTRTLLAGSRTFTTYELYCTSQSLK